jgi:ferritin
MAEIKSTLEKVLERAATMGQASQEELASEEKKKQGMRLAADYLQGQATDFSAAQETIEEEPLVRKGLVEVFLRNIILPRDEDQQRTARAMQGLIELGRGSAELVTIFSEMKQVLEHYLQHKQEIRNQVEEAFRQQMEQALAQQTGQAGLGTKVDPSLHPKFQEEWSRIKGEVDEQYGQALEQHKNMVAQKFLVAL